MSAGRAAAGLVAWVVLCLVIGFLGSLVTTPAIPRWYRGLRKPAWTPPGNLFGPVWTVLYVLMGVAAWLAWRRQAPGEATALALFGVQLGLNLLWSLLFFGLRAPGAAFGEIVALWALIVLTVIAFWEISVAAGILMLPYLAWVTFAAALNFAVWRMNSNGRGGNGRN